MWTNGRIKVFRKQNFYIKVCQRAIQKRTDLEHEFICINVSATVVMREGRQRQASLEGWQSL